MEEKIIDFEKENKKLKKTIACQKRRIEKIIQKLRIKTSGLWFSAGVIADNNLMPNKTQEEIYEILKMMGLQISEENKKKEQANG